MLRSYEERAMPPQPSQGFFCKVLDSIQDGVSVLDHDVQISEPSAPHITRQALILAPRLPMKCSIPTKKILSLLLQILLISVWFWAACPAWEGKVLGVPEGDTITVLHQGKEETLWLYGIDCPENLQTFGPKARRHTSDILVGKVVRVEPVETDGYARPAGLVYLETLCVNAEIVKAGWAWVYRKHCTKPFCSEWMTFEAQARKRKAGLWQHQRPTPPWEYRSLKRK